MMSGEYVGVDCGLADAAISRLVELNDKLRERSERVRAALDSVQVAGDHGAVLAEFDNARSGGDEVKHVIAQTTVGMVAASQGWPAAQIDLLLQNARGLYGWPGVDAAFQALSASKQMGDEILDIIDKGDDFNITNSELNKIREILASMSTAERDAVLQSMTDIQAERLFHNVHSDGFWSNDWDDRERMEFYELLDPLPQTTKDALIAKLPVHLDLGVGLWMTYAATTIEVRSAGDPDAEGALKDLWDNGDFRLLDIGHRVALLNQASNYAERTAIANLERLATKDYFAVMTGEDAERTAKIIGDLSVYVPPGAAAGSQAATDSRNTLDNTLEQLLDPDSLYVMAWSTMNTGSRGSASGFTLTLNRALLDAGPDPVAASLPQGISAAQRDHMVYHTVAHEVNHLRTGAVSDFRSYEQFMNEYRAWYVGFVAQHGERPTQQDAQDRLHTLVGTSDNDNVYDNLDAARNDPVEGALIADFIDDMYGTTLQNTEILDTVNQTNPGPNAPAPPTLTNPTDPAPVPVPVNGGPNNLDNS